MEFTDLDNTVVQPCYDLVKTKEDVVYFGITEYSVCHSFSEDQLNKKILKLPSNRCMYKKAGGKETVYLYKVRPYGGRYM
jgi:hypothetical protein